MKIDLDLKEEDLLNDRTKALIDWGKEEEDWGVNEETS